MRTERRAQLLFLILALPALAALPGCGGEPTAATEQGSAALRCSEAPEVRDGIATSVGCSFVQQDHNIRTWGQAFGRPVELRDGKGTPVATVQLACDEWLLGADADGRVVIISRSSGEVRSHGSMHAGQTSSGLPAQLELPLAYDP